MFVTLYLITNFFKIRFNFLIKIKNHINIQLNILNIINKIIRIEIKKYTKQSIL